MAVAPEIDRRAVVSGAAVGLIVCLASILVYRLIEAAADLRDDNNWVFIFVALIIVGWGVGGFRAARSGTPDAPYTHGALAALGAYAVVAVVGIARLIARGDGIPFRALLLFTFVAATAGIVGALLAITRVASREPH